MTYRTLSLRLHAASARAQHLREHLTGEALDSLFEALTRRPVTTLDWRGTPDLNRSGASLSDLHAEADAVHRTIHATGVGACCELTGTADRRTRSAAHGPLAVLAVDGPAATDLSTLSGLLDAHLEEGDDPLVDPLARTTRSRQREQTLRVLRVAALAAATTGFVDARHLEDLWAAAVFLVDDTCGPDRQRAVRALAAHDATGSTLPELLTAASGVAA